jgi:hypothetical protein
VVLVIKLACKCNQCVVSSQYEGNTRIGIILKRGSERGAQVRARSEGKQILVCHRMAIATATVTVATAAATTVIETTKVESSVRLQEAVRNHGTGAGRVGF